MMNNFLELYHDPRFDDVVFMENNHRVGIGFRKMLLFLDKESFYAFLLQVRQTSENNHIWNDPQVQSVMIETPCNGLMLLITPDELDRLQKMLETANDLLNGIPEWQNPAITTAYATTAYRNAAGAMNAVSMN
ncbi:MAG: hypothetical protein KF746_10130 [Chitinophagaceae bacterium]|nr:hypothetical protein [Chitinophagaceae bacterium]